MVDKIRDEDLDSNVKLLEWSERKFQSKVLEKIPSAIALRQVDLATKVESVKTVLENIFSLNQVMLCQSIHARSKEGY